MYNSNYNFLFASGEYLLTLVAGFSICFDEQTRWTAAAVAIGLGKTEVRAAAIVCTTHIFTCVNVKHAILHNHKTPRFFLKNICI